MAFVLVLLKALVEIAALALFAQLVVGIFAWGRRDENPIYRLLQIVASPLTRLVRWLTPKIVLDRHIPLAAFLLLVFVWIATVYGIARTCADEPRQTGCARLHPTQ
jgi:hypothetical protein